MCSTGGLLKFLKHAHTKANFVYFFQEDNLTKIFRLWQAKIIGNLPIPNPRKKNSLTRKYVQLAEKLNFQVRQKNVHIWQLFGKKN